MAFLLADNAPIPIPGFSDPFSSISHLAGAVIFAALSIGLLRRGWGRTGRVAALGVFAFSCVFLLSMSGVYHLLDRGTTGRLVLQRLDHAAIFTLIAGTFTAAHAIMFRGFWRWGMIAIIWTLAITGITLKTIFFDSLPESLGLLFYVAMGWIGVLSSWKLHRVHKWLVVPLMGGGLAYTVGAAFEFAGGPILIDGVIGGHEIFHVFVLIGVSSHWRFVYYFADGRLRPSYSPPTGKVLYALDEHHVDDLLRLYAHAWWADGRKRADVAHMLKHSQVVALTNDQNELIAFARVLSDQVYEGFILDVVVDDDYDDHHKLTERLIDGVIDHPQLRRVRRFEISCPPHLADFYARWSFNTELGDEVQLRREVRLRVRAGS